MRQLFDSLQQDIAQFIEQRTALWLILNASESDIPVVAKLITEVERTNQTDVFFTILSSFASPTQFVQSAWEQFEQEFSALSTELRAKGHPVPSLPLRDVSHQTSPQRQLQQLFGAVRRLVPTDGSHRLVMTIAPLKIHSEEEYVQFVSGLVDSGSLPDWTHGLRIIVREPKAHPHRFSASWPAQRVWRRQIDFGPAAIRQAMEETAKSPLTTQEERRQAQLMIANLDAAHGRTNLAIPRYRTLLAHYQEAGDATMQAVILNHMGELHHRQQELDLARSHYERALEPALAAENPVLTAILARNLGDLAFLCAQFDEATKYYDVWREVAEKLQDAEGSVMAYQKLGLAHERLGQNGLAATCYEIAEQLCTSLHIEGLSREHLAPLLRIYEQHGPKERANAVAQQLIKRTELST